MDDETIEALEIDLDMTPMGERMLLRIIGEMTDAECPHDSFSGDEGPLVDLGRWPVRWRCDGCGHIRRDEDEL